jgi:hypothetical protein
VTRREFSIRVAQRESTICRGRNSQLASRFRGVHYLMNRIDGWYPFCLLLDARGRVPPNTLRNYSVFASAGAVLQAFCLTERPSFLEPAAGIGASRWVQSLSQSSTSRRELRSNALRLTIRRCQTVILSAASSNRSVLLTGRGRQMRKLGVCKSGKERSGGNDERK